MLVRPDAGGPAVYLTRRHAKSSFMPDAFVFPGGAVDPDDRTVAASGRVRGRAGSAPAELVVAAVRETLEEAGILVADDERGGGVVAFGAEELRALRGALARGTPFSALLAARRLVLDAERFAYYSNWITPATEPKRFDTHFFLARAPADQLAAADAVEVYDGTWLRPSDALAAGRRGEMTIPFPTMRHLERLAAFDDLDALFAHAHARRVVPVRPVEEAPGVFAFDASDW